MDYSGKDTLTALGKYVKEKIDTASDVIDYTDQVTINENVKRMWSTSVKKVGKNVNFVVNIQVNSLDSYSVKLGTLPAAVRPMTSVSVNTLTNAGIFCYIFVDADGGFGFTKSSGTWTENEGVRGCFSFITAN